MKSSKHYTIIHEEYLNPSQWFSSTSQPSQFTTSNSNKSAEETFVNFIIASCFASRAEVRNTILIYTSTVIKCNSLSVERWSRPRRDRAKALEFITDVDNVDIRYVVQDF